MKHHPTWTAKEKPVETGLAGMRLHTPGSAKGRSARIAPSWLRTGLIGLLIATAALAGQACDRGEPDSAGLAVGVYSKPAAQIERKPNLTLRDIVPLFTRYGVGPHEIGIELTYAPQLFFDVLGLEPPAEALARPTLAFILQENIHEGALPGDPPAIFVDGSGGGRVAPYSSEVTASDPHHRTTRLLFPAPPALANVTPKANSPETLRVVVPFEDGAVSVANTFVWQLPIELKRQPAQSHQ